MGVVMQEQIHPDNITVLVSISKHIGLTFSYRKVIIIFLADNNKEEGNHEKDKEEIILQLMFILKIVLLMLQV